MHMGEAQKRMSALPEAKMTVEQYLAFERASETRHEFLNGEVFALAGASRKHNIIGGNVYASLHSLLRKRPCEVYQNDMRVKIRRKGHYAYPDIVVVCGTAKFEDDKQDTLLNPTVIVEVLSPSTEIYDRGMKFQYYRTVESLQEYVLISQDQIQIEHFTRQNDGLWLLSDLNRIDVALELPSIECKVPLADIYEKVEFDSAP
jgi:Uma2 family endonuclease